MTTSAPKAKQMEGFIDSTSVKMFGRSRTDSIMGDVCVTCGEIVTGFKDALSEKEYRISGMCQKCQDSVFG